MSWISLLLLLTALSKNASAIVLLVVYTFVFLPSSYVLIGILLLGSIFLELINWPIHRTYTYSNVENDRCVHTSCSIWVWNINQTGIDILLLFNRFSNLVGESE